MIWERADLCNARRPNEGFWEQLKVYEECDHNPRPGKAPYDAWLARFYKWESKL